jgi:hypothetical protein
MDSSLQNAKEHIATLTRHGAGHMIASVILWVAFGLIALIPGEALDKPLIYILGACILWPLAVVIGSVSKAPMLVHDSPFSSLFVIICALQWLFAPILIAAYQSNPGLVPWYFGENSSMQLLMFAWLLNRTAYLFCALGTLEVSVLIGWLAPIWTYQLMPAVILPLLLVYGYFQRGRRIAAGTPKPT